MSERELRKSERSDEQRPALGARAGTEAYGRPAGALSTIVVLLIVVSPLYYFLIWKIQRSPTPVKWLTVLAVLASLVVVYILFKSAGRTALRFASDFLIVFLIVFGAGIIAICFGKGSQYFLFKLFLIAYLSFLPPWVYLQFISVKRKSLWDEYVLNLHRLHFDHYAGLPEPPRNSIFHEPRASASGRTGTGDAEGGDITLYQKKFEGLYGPVSASDASRLLSFRGENLFPVAMAALLISIGWVFTIQPESIFDISLSPAIPATSPSYYFEALRYAFLGAYFYVMQMLVRRYFQNDLKTNAYLHSILRLIMAIVLAWVVAEVLRGKPDMPVNGLAFVIGVFPYVGWQVIQKLVKAPLKLVIPSLRSQYPLSDLTGLNIWYESRLLEEGIEDMQNLATANIIDLMLNTRVPIERLIDWIDQALLRVHIGKDKADSKGKSRDILLRHGIRTASDLIDVYESGDREALERLEDILNKNSQEPTCLRCIYITIKNEPNLFHVRQWKSFSEKMGGRKGPPSALTPL